MGCSRPWITSLKQLINRPYVFTALVVVIQLWQFSSGADPPPVIQEKVTVCFHCKQRTANFSWMHPLKPFFRIKWLFGDITMTTNKKTALNFTQESLTISQRYKGRFNLLKPGGVAFYLDNVTRDDIGTYRCIITLQTGVGETLEGVLEERNIDKQENVKVYSHCNAVFNWTLRNMSFSLIQWQMNGTTFASTTKTGFSTDSLDISDDYKPRFRLLKQGDVGFQLDFVSRNDAGTYTCTSQSREFKIVADLDVKDQQTNFNITVNNQGTLTCGESRDSTYSWIFSNTPGRENETSTGHELTLSSIPQKGSVYCHRQSDCKISLPYSFSSAEVPEEGGSNTVAVVVPIVVIIIIIIVIVIVIILRKRRRERERISGETGGGETVSGVEEQML